MAENGFPKANTLLKQSNTTGVIKPTKFDTLQVNLSTNYVLVGMMLQSDSHKQKAAKYLNFAFKTDVEQNFTMFKGNDGNTKV